MGTELAKRDVGSNVIFLRPSQPKREVTVWFATDRAVVIDGYDFWVLEVCKPYRAEKKEGPDMCSMITDPHFLNTKIEDIPPFRKVFRRLRERYVKFWTLLLLLMSVESGVSVDARQKCISDVKRFCRHRATFEYIKKEMLDTPFPDEAEVLPEVLARASEELRKLIEDVLQKWRKPKSSELVNE